MHRISVGKWQATARLSDTPDHKIIQTFFKNAILQVLIVIFTFL